MPGWSCASPANCAIAIGIWLPAPPVISMASWACAWPAASASVARTARSVRFTDYWALCEARLYRREPAGSPLSPLPDKRSLTRPEPEPQVAHEQLRLRRPRQRRGFQDRALPRVVERAVAARARELHAQHFAGRQERDVELRLRVPGQVGRQDDVRADLRLDLVLPRVQRGRIADGHPPGLGQLRRGGRELAVQLVLHALAGLLLRAALVDDFLLAPLLLLLRAELLLLLLLGLLALLPLGLFLPPLLRLLLLLPLLLERDVGLRRGLRFDLRLRRRFRLGRRRLRLDAGRRGRLGRPRLLDRRQLAPQLGHHRVGLLRLPADPEEEHREERDVHRDREQPREAGAGVALLERPHQVRPAGFTIRPT